MISALYTALSSMSANENALRIEANNIANINTTAFQGSKATFGDVINGITSGASQSAGGGTQLTGISRDSTGGALFGTGGSLDLALTGNGYFIVKNQQGAAFYTRAGNFQVDKEGYIATATGNRLQGYTNGVLGSLNIGGGAQGSNVRVSGDGTLSVVLEDGQMKAIGQIAEAKFNNPGGLASVGNNLYTQTASSADALTAVPATGGIITGTLETSNVDLAEQLTGMAVSENAFKASIKTAQTAYETMKSVLDLKK
ncbi:MAG: flagellar hook basal-body protein [Nitrospirae bacterium]|nr:flagellar hook basal-body protein [Nitrospirota bacterium]